MKRLGAEIPTLLSGAHRRIAETTAVDLRVNSKRREQKGGGERERAGEHEERNSNLPSKGKPSKKISRRVLRKDKNAPIKTLQYTKKLL